MGDHGLYRRQLSYTWKSEKVIEGSRITCPEPSEWNRFKKDSTRSAPDSEYLTFNRVYYGNVTETAKGQTLAVLEAIVQSDDGVRAWLEDILDYAYCRNCGHIYDSAVTGDCNNCNEDTPLKVAKVEYSDIIDKSIAEFGERLVRFAYEYHEDLTAEQSALEERRSEQSEIIADAKQSTGFGDFSSTDDEEVQDAKRKLETIRSEIKTVDELLDEYDDMSLANVHDRSIRSEFTPQLRVFGDNVAVTRYRRNPKTGKINEEQESTWDRNAAMALRNCTHTRTISKTNVATLSRESTRTRREPRNSVRSSAHSFAVAIVARRKNGGGRTYVPTVERLVPTLTALSRSL